ncbi:TPA: hypothetical protein ACH3X1_006502 [Trebouxia sp. C0004]
MALIDAWDILKLAAKHYQDSIAYVDPVEQSSLTYGQLLRKSTKLAAWLQGQGVGRGDRVAVMLHNSIEIVQIHFAAAALHAIVVNVNTHWVDREINLVLQDSSPRVVLLHPQYLDSVKAAMQEATNQSGVEEAPSACSVDTIVLVGSSLSGTISTEQHQLQMACLSYASIMAHSSELQQPPDLSGNDGYQMYYTSGTTGRPKGVVLSQKIVVTHALGTIQEMSLNSRDVWGHFAPMFHLVDAFAIYAITLVGGRHAILPTFTAQEALLTIERERVSCTNFASTMVTLLVSNPLLPQLDLSCLRIASCGGSPLPPATVRRAIAAFGCPFFISYGMTECCGKISMSLLPMDCSNLSPQEQCDLVCTSGRPFCLLDVRLMGPEGIPLKPGSHQVGEVQCRGPTVFQGYWQLPQASQEAFTEDGWFCTGDLGTINTAAYITVVDRIKDMILHGGENVYCSEVEAVLSADPQVLQAAAFGMPNAVMGEMVHCAIVLRQPLTTPVTPQAVMTWCQSQLALYKCPTSVHIVDELPTTGSGKVLKSVLRATFSKGGASAAAATAAAGPAVNSSSPASGAVTANARPVPVAAGGSGADCSVKLLDAVLAEVNGISLIDCPAEGFCLDPSLRHILVANNLSQPVMSQLCALPSIGAGDHINLLTTATPDATTTAQLQQLVNTTQACLTMTVIPSDLLSQCDQATAAAAVALALQGMPPPHAVAVLRTSEPAVLSLPQPVPISNVASQLNVHSTACVSAAALTASSARDSLMRQVAAAAAQAIGDDVTSPDEPLMDAGLNSSGAVQLVSLLEASIGLELPATLAFDYPSIAEIADYLLTLHEPNLNTASTAGTSQLPSTLPEASTTAFPALQSHSASAVVPVAAAASSSSHPDLTETITAAVADVLGLQGADASELSLDNPLMDAGLSSTLAIQLTSQLEALLHRDLPGTLVFDYPTVTDIAAFVASLDDTSPASSQLQSTKPAATAGGDLTNLPQAQALKCLVACLVTEITGDAVDPHTPLMEAGLTSATAIQLTTALEETLATDLPGTLIFDYPTVDSLVTYLAGCGVHLPADSPAVATTAAAEGPALTSTASSMATSAGVAHSALPLELQLPRAVGHFDTEFNAVAIVASAHHVPGGSLQPGASTTPVDRISRVPLDRWNMDEPALDNPSELSAAYGSFLSGADHFDPAAFHLSASEATLMDPQQRLLLESFAEAQSVFNTWDSHACGGDRLAASGGSIKQHFGVYVGVSQLEYARITYETGINLNAYYATGAHLSVTSGRIAYSFGLKGPALAVDTACSSSLVTTHLAAKAVMSGEVAAAASMGVNLTLVQSWTRACLRAGMLSEEGRCKTLDASADGYVRAEAVGCVILVPASAVPEGMLPGLVHLSGSAVNQDGRSSSLTAPNGPSQQGVIRQALQAGSLDGRQVSQLQMHGTGTPLGDPIEMGAVAAVILAQSDSGTPRWQPLTLTAAKAMMGHSEPAAGLVGLLTIAAELTHSTAPGLLHLTSLNPYVSSVLNAAGSSGRSTGSGGGLVSMSRQTRGAPLVSGMQMHGGVSSFAFQGTNAHAVVSTSSGDTKHGSYLPAAVALQLPMQKQRHWVLPKPHSLLVIASSQRATVVMQCQLADPNLAFFLDHQVMGRPLFPAAAMLEVGAAAAKSMLHDQVTDCILSDLVIAAPIILTNATPGRQPASLQLQTTVDAATGMLQIGCMPAGSSSSQTNARCVISIAAGPKESSPKQELQASSHGAIVHLIASLLNAEDSQAAVAAAGEGDEETRRRRAGPRVGTGADNQAAVAVAFTATAAAVAQVVVPKQALQAGFLIPPQTLDSTFHLGVVTPGSGVKVPVAIGAYVVPSQAADSYIDSSSMHACVAQGRADASSPEQSRADFCMLHQGKPCVLLSDLVTKVLPSPARAQPDLKLAESQDMYEVQQQCVVEPVQQLQQRQLRSRSPTASSIWMKTVTGHSTFSKLAYNPVQAASSMLELLHRCQTHSQPQIHTLTDGTTRPISSMSRMGARVMDGVVSGLLRTAATELTGVRVSLSTADHHSSSLGLMDQTNAPAASQCLGFLDSATVVAGTLSKPQLTHSKVRAPGHDLFQLRPEPRGSLSNLTPMPFDASWVNLKPNEVLVQVRAVGLNFRDVLNVLGMYPGDPGPPGADCAGVIMAVGPAVATSNIILTPSFRVGDAVFGIAPGSLGSCVATSSSSLVQMPTHLRFHEAATVPTVMVTGQVALMQAAQVAAGDTVLVHAAAGGVGLAAIQLLHALGATVIATAGSAQKRAVLHQLGVKHVVSSRLTQFVAEVAQLGGVDVVVNSLTSAGMVAASMAVLKAGGRFIEISKRDIWAQQLVALARPDCSFSYIAVDFLSPLCIQSSLQWVSAALTKGTLCPLPSICHPLGNAPAAFRQMMQASHVGKVVLTHPATGMGAESAAVGPSVTITGGLGGLGLLMATWATHQAALPIHITLLSRSGRTTASTDFHKLLQSGASVTAHMTDASFQSDAACLSKSKQQGASPLSTLLHASGVLKDSVLQGQSAAGLRVALAPKVAALTAMSSAIGLLPLQHVALFSSVASLLGTAGQANYAAANAGLDAWAAAQQAAGGVATAVQWGAWSSTGMATDAVLARLKRLGQGFLQPSAGVAAMQAVLHSMATASPSTAVIAVNPFDWPTYTAAMTPIPHFFTQLAVLADTSATAVASVSGQSNAAVASMAGGVATARAPALSHEAVSAQVQTALQSIIGESVGLEQPLMSAGLDSLGSVEFANVLSRRFGMQMPGTLVFDYPTVNAVSAYLHSKMQMLSPDSVEKAQAAAITAEPATAVLPVTLSGGEQQGRPTAVAILAAASHPMATASHSGGSSAWDQDLITLIPDARWDADSAAGQKHSMQARFGSFMRDVELFDSAAFGLSLAEGVSMDPQQRCLLQCTAAVLHTMQHGVPSGPSLTRAGVFVGISWTEYAKMASTHGVPVGAYTTQSAVLSVAAGRISYHFGFKGPAVAMDTACSSSLVAANAARECALSHGHALTGGINTMLLPSTTDMFQRAGMLTRDGRCKALDAAADGYVRSESCAMVMMASSWGESDLPCAIMVGSAVNQDGRASSLTAPNGPSQAAVIREALTAAGTEAAAMRSLHLHGTGTSLGDPIEAAAAAGLLVADPSQSHPLTMMAAKSSIGHSEPAAGVMNMLHACQAMQSAATLSILHLRSVNPHVSSALDQLSAKARMHLPRQPAPAVTGITSGASMVSGVSAFAFQGTNAHVIMQGANRVEKQPYKAAGGGLAWQQSRHWLLPQPQMLLSAFVKLSGSTLVMQCQLHQPKLAGFLDHQVLGKAIFPAAGFLELAQASAMAACQSAVAGQQQLVLTGISIPVPLDLHSMQAQHNGSGLVCQLDLAAGSLALSSQSSTSAVRTHMYGSIRCSACATHAHSSAEPHMAVPADSLLKKLGLLDQIHAEEQDFKPQHSIAGLATGPFDTSGMALDPAALDSSFHLAAIPRPGSLCVPATIQAYYIGLQRVAPRWTGCAYRPDGQSALSSNWLGSTEGQALGTVQELLAKPMQPSRPQAEDATTDAEILYETVWQASDSIAAAAGRDMRAALSLRSKQGAVAAALHAMAHAQQAQHTQHVSCQLLVSIGPNTIPYPMPQARATAYGPLVTALLKSGGLESKGLYGGTLSISQLLPGGKTLPPLQLAAKPRSLLQYPVEAAQNAGLALRPHLVKHHAISSAAGAEPFQLLPQPRGALHNLVPVPISIKLQPGMVWVEVQAVGVNFRDVLNVLGMYPGDPGPPGADCAGVVTAVAAGVAHLQPGMAVLGLAPGCLGSHVQANASCLVQMPAQLTHAQAATIPTVYITADTAFRQATMVKSGDRVLVHAAAGGVGLAAVQVLAAAQAEVVASAGAPSKRALLRQLGNQYVVNSRNIAMASDVAALGGVTVVLNSLTSPGMVAGSLAGVRPGGRFVEISKRDIWSPARLAQDRPDLHYSLLALDFLPPSALQSALTRAAQAVSSGSFCPLPQIMHSISSTDNALRQMSQARHVGKVVITAAKSTQQISNPSSSWLITGGLGSLGSLTADWLINQGHQNLTLIGRTGKATSEAQSFVKLVSGSCNAAVSLLAADLASAEAAATACLTSKKPLTGLIHASGVLADSTLQNQSAQSVRSVMTAKVTSLEAIHQKVSLQPCHSSVLFSSVASFLGSAGQANYSAANGALDGLAAHWAAQGQAGVSSVQWGGWAGGGMAGGDASTVARLARMGMPLITPSQGLAALSSALTTACHLLTAVPFAWSAFLGQAANQSNPAYADFMPGSSNDDSTLVAKDVASGSCSSTSNTLTLSRDALLQQITTAVETVIGHVIGPDEPLMAAGLDSLGTIELRNTLESKLGLQLPATLVFDYPTVNALADLLYPKLAVATAAAAVEQQLEVIHSHETASLPATTLKLVPHQCAGNGPALIAMTAMVIRSSQGAISSIPGTDAVRLIPLERWDADLSISSAASSSIPSRFGAFLSNVDRFDSGMFGLGDAEAALMDPQQRLLLETIAEAQRASGRSSTGPCGVFVGVSSMDYQRLTAEQSQVFTGYNATSTTLSVTAGRIAYTFGLKGPAMAVDTACSSSLVTLHVALNSLHAGQCTNASSSGVNLLLTPHTHAMFQVAGMLSAAGRCQTLDSGADGYVRAEGCGTMMLQKADESHNSAQGDGQAVLAFMHATAVNQDGRSSSLTAPNGPSQQGVIRQALQASALKPAHMHALQLHGTGTPLGDPIEFGAAAAVMAADKTHSSPLSLLAAKSWCGHSEPAAGVLGLAHAHLALSQQSVLPVLHLRSMNPHIESSFNSQASDVRKMVTARQTGPRAASQAGSQRFCGTSAFAFQGTNAHAIMSVQSPGTACQSAMVKAKALPFQRRRHWVAPLVHPLLTTFKRHSSKLTVLEANLAAPSAAYLWDHIVADRSLMPGAGSFDLACSAAKLLAATSSQSAIALVGATLPSPLLLPQRTANSGAVTVQVSVNNSHDQVRVANGSPQQTHLIGYLSRVQSSSLPKAESPAHSSQFASMMRQIWELESHTAGVLFGMLTSSKSSTVSSEMCPAQLDCAFQLGAALSQGRSGAQSALRVPVGVDAVVMGPRHSHLDQQLAATAQMQSTAANNSTVLDVALGRLCRVCNLLAKPLQSGKAAQQAQQASPQDSMLYVMSRPASEPGQLLAQTADGSLSRTRLGSSSLIEVYAKAIALAKTAAATSDFGKPGFTLQTSGALTTALTAQAAPTDASSNALVGLRALVKTLGHEHPTMLCHASDFHPAHASSRTSGLPPTIHISNGAQKAQHASSGQAGVLHSSKLLPVAAVNSPVLSGPFQLMPSPRGALGNLKPVSLLPQQPAAGQVLLEVHAVGVNFRDVLNVLGMYPGDPGAPGADCAGVVIASGKDVQGLVQGQRVFGQVAGSLGSHVVTDSRLVVAMPPHATFEQAATMPTVFMTADMAFTHAMSVAPGTHALIHATAACVACSFARFLKYSCCKQPDSDPAGGVGLAAGQVARSKAIHVVATAGSSSKRSLLRNVSCQTVVNSRDTVFATDLAQLAVKTSSVLNSLTSPGMLAASLATLQTGGQFVEIGKRDIWSAARVAQDRPDVSYHFVAVDFLPKDVIQHSLHGIARGLSQGSRQPLPQVLHEVHDAQAAFRQMSQARHVGKIVIQTQQAQHAQRTSSTAAVPGLTVITGGLGTLGSMVADWMSSQQQGSLCLVGRSGRLTSSSASVTKLLRSHSSAEIIIARADVSVQDEIHSLVDELMTGERSARQLQGLIHSGGALADATLTKQTLQGLRDVWAPKVTSAELWSQISCSHSITTQVLFSSVASLLGSAGQANYSAANGALDGLAAHWAAQGRAGVSSVQWGGWAGGGMAGGDASTAARLARMGMPLITPSQGLAALARVLSSHSMQASSSCMAAVHVVWPTFLSRLQKKHQAVFSEFVAAPQTTAAVPDPPPPASTHISAAHTTTAVTCPVEQARVSRDMVHSQVQSAIQAVLGEVLGDMQPLMAGGLDSLGAVEMRNSLQSQLGLELPSTLVFDYPTVTALVDFLHPQLTTATPDSDSTTGAISNGKEPLPEPFSMGGFPALVSQPGASVSTLSIGVFALEVRSPQGALGSISGKDTAVVIPLSRWDTAAQDRHLQQTSVRFASVLDHVDAFDAAFFGVSSSEAELMDPQQRLVLECTTAVAMSQLQEGNSSSHDCGVFVGVSSTDYARLTDKHQSSVTAYSATSSALSVAAGRVSYTFGFKGPCLSVDTACSSSLVSLHSAVHALRAFECSAAVNAGVNLTLMPDTPSKFQKAGMLSMTGRCQTLEQGADGYGRSEACVAMWLQTLDDSSSTDSQGKQLLAVIQGSAVTQDGRSSTLTAPNGPSQQEVLRRALLDAATQPNDVALNQLHGTGKQACMLLLCVY